MDKKKLLCLLLPLMILAACDSRTVGSSSSPEPSAALPAEEVESAPGETSGSLLEQMEAVYAMMDAEPLPLKGADTYAALDSYDGGTQLAKEDETAKKLAGAVANLLDAYGNGLGAYSGGDELSMAKTTTAIWHTAPIDFSWEISREGDFACAKPDHVLAVLVKRELDSGRTPVALYYADEVHKTAARLFGSAARITDMDTPPYYYYEKEGVYILMEEPAAGGKPIPQILSYEKTDTGYRAEAVIVEEKDGKLELNGQPLTKENFAEQAAGTQHLRYTFRDEGGVLALETLETWRPEKE